MYRNRDFQDESQRIDRRGWVPLESLIHGEMPALGHESRGNRLLPGVMMLHGEVPALGHENRSRRGWSPVAGLLRSEVAPLGRENEKRRPRIGGGIVKIDPLGRRIRGTDPTKIQILPLGGGARGAGGKRGLKQNYMGSLSWQKKAINPTLTEQDNELPKSLTISYVDSDGKLISNIPISPYTNDSYDEKDILKKNKAFFIKERWNYLPLKGKAGYDMGNLINCAGFAATGTLGAVNTKDFYKILTATAERYYPDTIFKGIYEKYNLRSGSIIVSQDHGHYGVLYNDSGNWIVIFTDGRSAIYWAPFDKYIKYPYYKKDVEFWHPTQSFSLFQPGKFPMAMIPGEAAIKYYTDNR